MGYLLAQDAINGKAGKGFMVVDGQNIELFGMKKFESSAEVQTDEFPVVGFVVDQTKVKGLKYSGTATVYYGTPAFLKILMEYKRTGRFPLINFQITNDDKGSSLGSQVIGIYGVTLTKIPIALLDDSASNLQAEISFNFTDFEPLQHFKDAPAQLGGERF